MFHTITQFVKSDSPLGIHFQFEGVKTTNLYNSAMFFQRQAMTGSRKKHAERQPNEHNVFHMMQAAKPGMDRARKDSYRKELAKARKSGDSEKYRKIKEQGPQRFELPSPKCWYLGANNIIVMFRVLSQPDYRALQSNQAQRVIRQVAAAWEAYFSSLKEWKQSPDKYKARPNIPGYRTKGSVSTVIYTNQNCRFCYNKKLNTWELSFPHTSERLNVTGLLAKQPINQYKLNEVKAVPQPGGFEVQITYDDGVQPAPAANTATRIAAIDFGVDNIASISNNVGLTPVIIKGNVLKSYNQWYNKIISHYKSEAQKQNGLYTTPRIQKLWYHRERFIDCMLGLISNKIISYLTSNKIATLVCGKNQDWKQNVNIGKTNNQNFVSIPHAHLISILEHKCAAAGILFISREESYTSKASFLDMDNIPTYNADNTQKYSFSGRRKHRGLYVSKNGRLINADVNAASNILRKEFPHAFDKQKNLNYLMNVAVWRIDLSGKKTKLVVA